jgi:hypothetical protein
MVDGRCANTAVVNGAITMTISDVSIDGNTYTVYDERCREVNRLYASNFGNGEMRGFGEHFLVLQDNNTFVIVNAENGQEIGRLYSSSVGQFKHANGRLMVFKDGSKLVVYEVNYSGVSEISSRYG